MNIIIKPLTSVDIPKVRALHSALLPVSYPASFFIQLTLQSARVCLVACLPAQPTVPVAFISACLRDNPRLSRHHTPHIEILTLGVLPAYRQQGIARLLVQHVYDYFRQHSTLSDSSLIHTNVATSNAPALSFYQRIGLTVASGVIPNLYRACPHGSRDGYLLDGTVQQTL
ncbi:hypothetical protein C0989_003273 [Termitomyces sp. Mn162]|nr:hypothetical protein C0989_003273 [Termitomyces sp. Mn162]